MKLPRLFPIVNNGMHIFAFLELCIIGLGGPVAFLTPPGEPMDPDPVFFPQDEASAAPIAIRISVTLATSLLFLVPALWVLTFHLARTKKWGPEIGWFVLVLAWFVCIQGLRMGYSGSAAAEDLFGMAGTFGLSAAVGGYLILYSKWIYGLLPGESNDLASDGTTIAISPETKQLVGRLTLFGIVVGISLVVMAILSMFPQFEKEPKWLTVGFFGVIGCGMLVTGLIREQTVARFIPWASKEEKSP
jgi:hypothetical protein